MWRFGLGYTLQGERGLNWTEDQEGKRGDEKGGRLDCKDKPTRRRSMEKKGEVVRSALLGC